MTIAAENNAQGDSALASWSQQAAKNANDGGGFRDDLLAGEDITITASPRPVCINPADGKVYMTDANSVDVYRFEFFGFVLETVTTGNACKIQTSGILRSTGASRTPGALYYAGNTTGSVVATPGTNRILVGRAISATELLIVRVDNTEFREAQEDISALDIRLTTAEGDIDDLEANTFEESILAGESINGTTTPVCGYIKNSDGRIWKTDASYRDERSYNFAGMVVNNISAGNPVKLIPQGLITVPSITLSSAISSALDQYCNFQIGHEIFQIDSTDDRISQAFKTGHQVGNISSIKVKLYGNSANLTLVCKLYAANSSGQPTGSALATSGSISSFPASVTTHEFTFASPYTVNPDAEYCFTIECTARTSGGVYVYGGGDTDNDIQRYHYLNMYYNGGVPQATYYSTNAGSSWTFDPGYQYWFETYTTSRKFILGDPVYLSETAGEYTPILPTTADSSIQQIARILSQTKLLLEPRREIYLGDIDLKGTWSGNNASTSHLFVQCPHRARKAIVEADWEYTGSGKKIFRHQVQAIKGEIVSVKTTGQYDTDDGVNLFVDWTGNCLDIYTDSTTAGNIGPLLGVVHFYT